ncbi:hypothetical protein MRX96_046328 [Rhipicephalus microplus]
MVYAYIERKSQTTGIYWQVAEETHRVVEQRATSRCFDPSLLVWAHPGSHDSEGLPGWASPHLSPAAFPQRHSWRPAGVVPGTGLSLSEVSFLAGTLLATLRGTVPVDVPPCCTWHRKCCSGFLPGLHLLSRATHQPRGGDSPSCWCRVHVVLFRPAETTTRRRAPQTWFRTPLQPAHSSRYAGRDLELRSSTTPRLKHRE